MGRGKSKYKLHEKARVGTVDNKNTLDCFFDFTTDCDDALYQPEQVAHPQMITTTTVDTAGSPVGSCAQTNNLKIAFFHGCMVVLQERASGLFLDVRPNDPKIGSEIGGRARVKITRWKKCTIGGSISAGDLFNR